MMLDSPHTSAPMLMRDNTPPSDEDAEHTIGCAATRRPIMDHNIVHVAGKNLKLLPVYCREIVVKRGKKSQNTPSQLDAGV
jgi:hypothetical protein